MTNHDYLTPNLTHTAEHCPAASQGCGPRNAGEEEPPCERRATHDDAYLHLPNTKFDPQRKVPSQECRSSCLESTCGGLNHVGSTKRTENPTHLRRRVAQPRFRVSKASGPQRQTRIMQQLSHRLETWPSRCSICTDAHRSSLGSHA